MRVCSHSGNNLNHQDVLGILTFRINKILETTELFSAEYLPSRWPKNNRKTIHCIYNYTLK